MSGLRERAKQLTESLPIMQGKEKGVTEKLIGEIVTIDDFDFMNSDKGEYAVFTVSEYPDFFFFAGQVLTDHLQKLQEDGLLPEVKEEGLPVLCTKKKAKESGRYYTNVVFYPEEQTDKKSAKK